MRCTSYTGFVSPIDRLFRFLDGVYRTLEQLNGMLGRVGSPIEFSMPKIALIEDDVPTSNKHKAILEQLPSAAVDQLFTYGDAVRMISSRSYDLLVVDIDLGGPIPGEMDGFDFLREFGTKLKTIIVTGMPEENLKTRALQLQAYEFVEKPVTPLDLLNKCRHALAFSSSSVASTPWPRGLELDPQRAPNLRWKGKPVQLTLTELTLVHTLAASAGKTVEAKRLIAAMKTGQTLASHILGVRRKFLAVDRQFDSIESDPGLGYLWKVDA